jgi:uncharacterized protein YegL
MNHNDLIDNPSPRCACALVLDVSGSMHGQPITQLNEGAQAFIEALRADEMSRYSVDVSIITAGDRVTEVLPFTNADLIETVPSFSANGLTPLGQAVTMALEKLESRKAEYRHNGVAYYQPWLVILSDGGPTDAWQSAAKKAQDLALNRKLVSLPVGVEGADLAVLSAFSAKGAKPLVGLRFREFFQWLSASMARVSASNSTTSEVKLPPTDSWDSI